MEAAEVRKRRGRPSSPAPSLALVSTTLPESVERQVYRSIRQALMSGRIEPDAVLTSRTLAQELKVSVQPVRDALKRLEADGILEGRPQSGFYLRGLSGTEYREITEIRQRIEGLAGRHAATNVSPATLRKLADINHRIGSVANPRDHLAENFRFHFTIYTKARRPALMALIENLWVRIGPALNYYAYVFDVGRNEVVQRHQAIIDGLAARDGDAVEAAIMDDLGSAAEVIIRALPPHPVGSKEKSRPRRAGRTERQCPDPGPSPDAQRDRNR